MPIQSIGVPLRPSHLNYSLSFLFKKRSQRRLSNFSCCNESTQHVTTLPSLNFTTNRTLLKCCLKIQQNRNKMVCRGIPSLSGEIFKEPLVDTFLTHLDQIAFSLMTKKKKTDVDQVGSVPVQPDSLNRIPANSQKLLRKKQVKLQSNSKKMTWDSIQTSPQLSTPLWPLATRHNDLAVQYLQKQNKAKISASKEKESQVLEKQKRLQDKLNQAKNSNFEKNTRFQLKKDAKKQILSLRLGDYVNCGDKIGEYGGAPIVVNASGKIIRITQNQIVLQKTQPVLYYSQAHVHVKPGQWVVQGAPILTLTHQTLVTGDIVQGIPRIEQLFEAPNSPPAAIREGGNLHETLHSRVREIFRKNWIQAPLPVAVRQSLQQIQQILVESIQKVYLSQGVLIADKHVEIVVRQMTSKAEVLESGNTGLLLEELLSVQQIENANLTTPGKKALYAPAVVGLTRSALESDSFISAASFQETTRVLSRDAITGKSDFLRGLKEKVVIGDLIGAGTGLDVYFVYTLLSHPQLNPFLKLKLPS